MKSWNLPELDVRPREPQVLDSQAEGRAIVLDLPAGRSLGEHQVHERAWLLVISGQIDVAEPDEEWAGGGPGVLVQFDPSERREITATEDARLLLLLAPWPGEGHPSHRGEN